MSIQAMVRALLNEGFTEEGIAVTANVNKSTISRIATGKTNSPRYHLTKSIELIFQKYILK